MDYDLPLSNRRVPGVLIDLSGDSGEDEVADFFLDGNRDDVVDLSGDNRGIEVVDLSGDDNNNIEAAVLRPQIPRRPHDPRTRIEEYLDHRGLLIKEGMCVEITSLASDAYQLQYLRVTALYQEQGHVTVRGVLFVRTRELGGKLVRKMNEVCKIFYVAKDDGRGDEEQSAIEVSVRRVVRLRYLVCTNTTYPEHRLEKDLHPDKAAAETQGHLTCRWVYIQTWATTQSRIRGKPPVEHELSFLTSKDASKARYRVPDADLRQKWRGNVVRPEGEAYTFGDMFCGGGGTSSGARQAGFKVHVACDADEKACNTYAINFPTTNLYEMDVSNFITGQGYAPSLRSQLDVLHLSPPCQPYSPAHTQVGKNDDQNTAVLFSCRDIVKCVRPRILTVEETFGILHQQHAGYLSSLVHGFTELGYSVRWKIEELWFWGTPCRRRRFIMIGSCPGERLPTFPAHTHAKGRLVTVAQALDRVRGLVNDPLHQPRSCRFEIPRTPWDDRKPLSTTLTCGGAQGRYHPSGRRDFTLRELATIQTFPADHQFPNITKTDARRQIGNAFPPRAAKVLLSHIRKWLEDADNHPVRAFGDGEVVVLDEDVPVITINDSGSDPDDGSDDGSDGSSVTMRGDGDDMDMDTGADADVDADMDVDMDLVAEQGYAVRDAVGQPNNHFAST